MLIDECKAPPKKVKIENTEIKGKIIARDKFSPFEPYNKFEYSKSVSGKAIFLLSE